MQVLFEIAYLIVIGFIAGWLAATLLGERRRYGVLGYIVVGAIGAIGGNYVFASLQIPNTGLLLKFIAAIVGSIALVAILRLFRR